MTTVSSHTLGEIALVQQGYTFKPEYQGQSAGKWVYAKVADLSASVSSKYLRQSINYISDTVLHAMGATPFPAGSIVFPRVGAALRNNNKRLLAQDSLTDDNVLVITVRNTDICSPEYLYYWFDFHDLQEFCNDGTVPVINGGNLKRQQVFLPNIQTQRKTAEVIDAWDNSIELVRQLIAAKEMQARAVASKLYMKKAGWSAYRLGDFLQEVKEFHGEETYVIGSVGKNGIKPRSEVYSKRLSDNHERNILVEPECLCFGLANDAIAFGVNFSSNTYSVSPAYKTFKIDGAAPGFIDGYLRVFNARLSKRYLITSARQGKAIDFDGLLGVHCHFPPLHEQHHISATLAIMQSEIDTLRSLIAAYKRQKRGLMQKLLTGQWRVKVPETEAV